MGEVGRVVRNGVTHNADVRRDPLEVHCPARGGQPGQECMDGEAEGVVCVWSVCGE